MKNREEFFEYVKECGGQNGLEDIMDYEKIREKLVVKLVDLKCNQEYLADRVYTVHGDFAATYAIILYEDREKCISMPVKEPQRKTWGISPEQLHQDAILADKSRVPLLMDLNKFIMSQICAFGKIDNYLIEGTQYHPMVVPMLCLTNRFYRNGASLILHKDILKRTGEVLGSNFYVLPSSIHEVVIVPDMGEQDVAELSLTVREINEEQVKPEERLSDKVQYYDCETAVLENAEERMRRLFVPEKNYEIKYTREILEDTKTKEETEEADMPLGNGEDIEKSRKLLPTV